MSKYAMFFDKDSTTYRLPTNPEELEISTVQASEKYEILKSGQIVVPSHMELNTYKFTVELPKEPYHYVETPNKFKKADYYLNLFKKWREELKPIRFIASNGIGDDINTLVLIEELGIVERAGEEGDKHVSFSLIEYKEFGKKTVVVKKVATNRPGNATKKPAPAPKTNPKNKGTYVIKRGDTLWAISKKYYGKGSQYPKIYNANRNIIKNPNLIYPGQKLVIPL